jgi:hypothetical protein
MYSFSYNAAATVCVMLLLGGACARDAADATKPQPAETSESFDASVESTDQGEGSDAGARSGRADAGSNERAQADSGVESRPEPSGSSEAGAGGATSRSTSRAGSGGQPAAGRRASSGAEAGGGASGSASEPKGAAGVGGGASGSPAETEGAAGGSEEAEAESAGSGGTGGAPSSSEEPGACGQIATACAAVTGPSEDVTACLGVGQAADSSACEARIEACRQTCGAPLCQQVLEACPTSDAGPVQGCHQVGLTDNAGDCFGDGVKCLEYCGMVVTP